MALTITPRTPSVMHKAHGDDDRPESRVLYRLILRGECPV